MGFLHGHTENHWEDADGIPSGGVSYGCGFAISWQRGALGRPPKEPNGAFVADVINAVIGRIAYYQTTRFACPENAEALNHLEAALSALERRYYDREGRRVQGTHAE